MFFVYDLDKANMCIQIAIAITGRHAQHSSILL